MMGNVVEIFDSVQGEGIYVGVRQTFVRFAGCNLNCAYCDTQHEQGNEMSVEECLEHIDLTAPRHSIAITGGEPLSQAPFAIDLARALRGEGERVYLETNGTLVDEFKAIVGAIDYCAIDFKIPEATGQHDEFEYNYNFLKIAYDAMGRDIRRVFVKIVVPPTCDYSCIKQPVHIVREISPAIVVIIQPMWGKALVPRVLLSLQGIAMSWGIRDVRIVPQVHRYMNVQ